MSIKVYIPVQLVSNRGELRGGGPPWIQLCNCRILKSNIHIIILFKSFVDIVDSCVRPVVCLSVRLCFRLSVRLCVRLLVVLGDYGEEDGEEDESVEETKHHGQWEHLKVHKTLGKTQKKKVNH